MLDFLIGLCIFFPILAGGAAYLDKSGSTQKMLTVVTGIVLIVCSLLIATLAPAQTSTTGLGAFLETPVLLFDFVLLGIILYIGLTKQSTAIISLAVIQIVGVIILKFFFAPKDAVGAMFVVDTLAVTMVLVVSIIGSIIVYYANGYMQVHEEHQKLAISKKPQFFGLLLFFLGAMNGLSLTDDLATLFFFWEVTTLCSYLLIKHDDTEEANKNAQLALVVNLAGGVAFLFALLYLQRATGTLSIAQLIQLNATNSITTAALMIPMIGLCIAGFTKAAQIPFQSWLCGAMVAPTPVSALLHSSTMVKAGIYIVLRLTPLYANTPVSSMIAICGAFTFIAAAALAVGQSNSKKVLAYSTISNLGLIIACAGINTKASIAAGLMLLIFHAISKALMFLCVGAIEQKIGSRDIEDMRGLYDVMPRTALITSFGILTMMLPPFGMLLAKWMALESAIDVHAAMPIVVTMLALGSGLTVLFWARWAGVMFSSAKTSHDFAAEQQEATINRSLRVLAYGAAVVSLLAPILYTTFINSAVGSADGGQINTNVLYAIYPIYILIGICFHYAWKQAKLYESLPKSLPYMGGMQAEENGQFGFTGPMKSFVPATASNYYLNELFGENKITRAINTVGITLLIMLLGGVLQ